MPQIYVDGHVSAHIFYEEEFPITRCFDNRNEDLEIVVVMDFLSGLPIGYGEEPIALPSPVFVVDCIHSIARHPKELWSAWEQLKNDF